MSEAAAVPGKLPVSFIENVGQIDETVSFYVHEPAATIFFAPDALVINLTQGRREEMPSQSLRIELLGASASASVQSVEPASGVVNIFRGDDPSKWYTNIPTHSRIAYIEPWPGIDVHFIGRNGRIESVYAVSPGADPLAIRLRYEGQDQLYLAANGDLVLHTPAGTVVEQAPVIYQESDGERTAVDGAFVLLDPRTVGFRIGQYDTSRPLLIDPTLVYSTYLGGSGSEKGSAIAVDSSGNAYIAGLTTGTNFPAIGGGFQTASAGDRDAFVTKLSAAGVLIYSTYLGGTGFDQANGLAIDDSGNAYVTGITASINFPTSSPYQALNGGGDDAFVTMLNSSGSALVYSTYIGGSDNDEANGIAVDASGNAYITGETFSFDYPLVNAFQPGLVDDDAFITKLNSSGSALLYSTYLGGVGIDKARAIAVDSAGSAYVTGYTEAGDFPTVAAFQASLSGGFDTFVTKFTAAGTSLAYSTYLGGSSNDFGVDIAVDSAGRAHVVGLTRSTNFPTSSPYQSSNAGGDDAFVAKLTSDGSGFIYSTYLGGSGGDGATSIALDGSGNAYVTGATTSTDFPIVSPYQASAGGSGDAFVTKLAPVGSSLGYSTYLGGSANDRGWGIAVDSAGDAYVTGSTSSTGFPTANALQSSYAGFGDGFVTRLSSLANPTNTPDPIDTPVATPNPTDTDGDGCTDVQEAGPNQQFGGLRDPNNPWDFYDVRGPDGPRDQFVDLFTDILGVIIHYSLDGSPPYDVDFDRGPSAGPNPWNMTAPDGVIDLFTDILGVISQYNHDCR